MPNKVQSSNKLATCWADDLSISGKWQAWLAMEEHDGMDSVSVGTAISPTVQTLNLRAVAARAAAVHCLLRLLVAKSPIHT